MHPDEWAVWTVRGGCQVSSTLIHRVSVSVLGWKHRLLKIVYRDFSDDVPPAMQNIRYINENKKFKKKRCKRTRFKCKLYILR